MNSLADVILKRALELGFDHASLLPAAPLPHAHAHLEWLAEGRHGSMGYLDRYHDLRADPRVLEPGTRTVLALLKNYRAPLDLLPGGLRIARYAHGDDYHEVLRARMRQLAAFIHAETGADVAARPAVDSAPLLERDLAASAGLGWIGKNTLLLHPHLGSFTFIAELLLDLDLPVASTTSPTPDRCGRCTRCLDACPTGAIVAPYVLDARRCISYLTIEHRGPIPRDLRPLIGDYLFGCDLCQDVCPWNRKAPDHDDPTLATRDAYLTLRPQDLLSLSPQAFNKLFRDSPIRRTKRRGLARNAAVVLGNRKDPGLLEVLRLEHDEPLVRGHLAWALGQLDSVPARRALEDRLRRETDAYVLEELRDALGLHDAP